MECKAYNEFRCRSCQYLDRSYAASLKSKEEHLFSLFPKETLQGYEAPFFLNEVKHSRNKAKLSVALVNNEIDFGLYSREQIFTKLEDCPLHLMGMNDFLISLKPLLHDFKIVPYDLKTRTGELKYVILTKSESTNEILCRFVLRSKESLDRLRKLAHQLEQVNQSIVMTANIQSVHSATLEGEEEIVLTNKKTIEHHYQNLVLALGPRSFFQVTSIVAQNLYQTIANFMQKHTIDSMLDLYCGVGAFSLYSAPFIKRAIGVEISADAISLAKINADRNHFPQLQYLSTDVNHFWSAIPNENFDLILVNPPRNGVGEKSINEILKLHPQFIVYSSCNALTLKRDFDFLKNRYQPIYSRIFDMFPFTTHYETLMIFQKCD